MDRMHSWPWTWGKFPPPPRFARTKQFNNNVKHRLTTSNNNASVAYDFMHEFHCRYLGVNDRMGLIFYGTIVQLVIPLGYYTQAEWDSAIDAIPLSTWGSDTSPNFRGQNPVLEVLDVAYRELFQNQTNRAKSTNSLFYLQLVTTNLPLQVPVAENKTYFGVPVTIPSPWAYPYPPRYLGSGTCINLEGVGGYSYCECFPSLLLFVQRKQIGG